MAIVKSNYTGSFSAARANLGYMSREQTSGEERGKIYNQYGEQLHKDEIKGLKKDIKEESMYRRMILSPNPNTNMNGREMKEYTRDVMDTYKSETGKDFKYIFAVHNHNGIEHSHVLAYGSRDDLTMDRKDFQQLREIGKKKEETIFLEKKLSGRLKSLHLGSEKISESIKEAEKIAEREAEM